MTNTMRPIGPPSFPPPWQIPPIKRPGGPGSPTEKPKDPPGKPKKKPPADPKKVIDETEDELRDLFI